MSNKKRSASSTRWLHEYFNDKYVQQVHKRGLRSRAWFKLEEIQQTDNIFKPGMTAIDLGAAPGGWSQYVTQIIGKKGRIIACDILPMDAIVGVEFIQGDFRETAVLQAIMDCLNNDKVDVVISDMSPNISGMAAVDIPRAMYLAELALEMCKNVVKNNGSFVVKIFQGEGFDAYLKQIKTLFNKVKIRKPDASRARSREVYIVATGRKL